MRRLRIATAVAMAVTLCVTGCTSSATGHTVTASTKAAAAVSIPRLGALTVPSNARAYVIGDSWTAGAHADPTRTLAQVAAAALGWSVTVDAESGTGYLELGGDGSATYPQRASAIDPTMRADLEIVQGGSNDVPDSLSSLPAAVAATVHALRTKFPGKPIVLLGPGPDPFPVSTKLHQIDTILTTEAATLGVYYISMIQQDWINAADLSYVIDPTNDHPTVAGDAYLGGRLAAALSALELSPSN